jgi:hypothetical protein
MSQWQNMERKRLLIGDTFRAEDDPDIHYRVTDEYQAVQLAITQGEHQSGISGHLHGPRYLRVRCQGGAWNAWMDTSSGVLCTCLMSKKPIGRKFEDKIQLRIK